MTEGRGETPAAAGIKKTAVAAAKWLARKVIQGLAKQLGMNLLC
jgi:hypothetical protein